MLGPVQRRGGRAGRSWRPSAATRRSAKNLGLTGGGRFEITIVDEDAKINVNLRRAERQLGRSDRLGRAAPRALRAAAVRPALRGARRRRPVHRPARRSARAIVDWADSDRRQRAAYPCQPQQRADIVGAAPRTTSTRPSASPYRRKNAPYDSLDELRLVRGVSDDFWATFVDPDPDEPQEADHDRVGSGRAQRQHRERADAPRASSAATRRSAELCTDPTQMASFLSGVTMAKSLTMGCPSSAGRRTSST